VNSPNAVELSGRVAVVTGGAAGIGHAISTALAEAGAALALLDIDGPAAGRAAQDLAATGAVAAVGVACDVADREQVERALDEVSGRLGPVDILVNNAGVSHVGKPTHLVSDEEWLRSVAVMQTGAFFCMRAVAPGMISRGRGSIINVASIRATVPNRDRIAYCAPKAALVMMTKVAAADWAASGIRVNAVCPGFQRTPMWDRDVESGAVDGARLLAMVPQGRIGDPSEVGALVVFLCSDHAAYINGAAVTIDGGLTSAMI
jgi:NAD(P)-dependent dehydrogenase (short-subunit alcohol dehydrogenase family)